MTNRRFAAVVGLIVALPVLAGILLPRPVSNQRGPDPYATMVNTILLPKDGQPLLQFNLDPDGSIVTLVADQQRDAAAFEFAQKSYLRRDLLANDRSIWKIRNDTVTEIVAGRYRDVLPSAGRRFWAGRLLYAPTFVASDGDRRDADWLAQTKPIELESITPNCPDLALTFTTDAVITGEAASADKIGYSPALCAGKPAVAKASRVDLFCRAGDKAPVARLVRVGDQVAVYRVDDQNACSVTIGRAVVRSGVRFAMPTGAVLRIGASEAAGYGFFRRGGDGRHLLSYFTREGVRAVDKPLEAWAHAVDRDYMRALIAGGDRAPEGAVIHDVATSLDFDLQTGLQRLLENTVKANRFMVQKGDRPLVATATILDARTGEVLAMASVDEAAPSPTQARVDPNLVPMPIGSTAKAIFATAALAARPDLADVCMTIKATGKSDDGDDTVAKQILGFTYSGRGLQTRAEARVTFGRFIETSNSGYLAGLLLLASPDNAKGGSVALSGSNDYGQGGRCDGKALRAKSIYENADTGGDRVNGSTLVPLWQRRLQTLFQLNIDGPGSIATARTYDGCLSAADDDSGLEASWGSTTIDATPWRGLVAGHPNGPASACLFDASAPRREALGLTGFRSFEEVTRSALGGGEGRLSTVKLAESYARIVTGRRVAASFVDVGDAALPVPIDPAIYPQGVRRVITAAMTRSVFGDNGTGRAARDSLVRVARRLGDAGLQLGEFAKTGTSSLTVSVLSDDDRTINLLIRRRCITGVTDAAGRSIATYTPSIGIDCQTPPNAVRLDELNQIAGAFVTRPDGALIGVSGVKLQAPGKPYAGKAFAMVVASYPRPPGAPDRATDAMANPRAAYSLAVNFGFRVPNPNGNPAAQLAGEVVERLLLDRLLAGATARP